MTSRARAWETVTPLRLRLGSGKQDVHLRMEHVTRKMCAGLPDVVTDLLEIAAYVYVADQATTRGGTKEFEYGTKWRREFRFEVPVRCPDVWHSAEVHQALTHTLGFQSDDDYDFVFSRMKNPPPIQRYLFDEHVSAEDHQFQEVMLFSGGLDSLGGAVQEILQGQRPVALVSHRPVSKVYRRQVDLVTEIVKRLPGGKPRPMHVAVEVNKGKPQGREFTQRSRSFLFAALAAVVARMFRLDRIRFYENGVTGLNLPISPQILGARATRTTHPKVLAGFERMFRALFETNFKVESPFQWKTRADVLRAIKAAGHGKLCALTSSCTHTYSMTTTHTHCGKCYQCVDRRLSALAACLTEEEDPPERYASDVLTAPRQEADLTLIDGYLGFARRMEKITTPAALVEAFPEVARTLRYLNLPAAQAAQNVLELCGKHGRDVCGALVTEVRRRTDDIVRHKLPANSLLSLACGRRPAQKPAAATVAHPGAFVDDQTLRVDCTRFEAGFRDKSCWLGNTMEFRLLERLTWPMPLTRCGKKNGRRTPTHSRPAAPRVR
jgi:7-cyano-7-deazaguanine synthase in queuosine biosynthesis